MLSIFPDILFLAPLSIFLFRVALAITLAYSAWHHFRTASNTSARMFGILEIVAAVMIGAGAWTQAAAMGAAIILMTQLGLPHMRRAALGTTILALVMAVSLIFTGPGVFSFDLPL